eukprot:m.10103 g.10103  ORF g.10103 m.10103 type:complete len:166 (-) comp5126_c0_seq1:565-1062(-)
MSVLQPMAVEQFTSRAVHNHVISHPDDLLAEPVQFANLDMNTLNPEDLEVIENSFSFIMTKDGTMHGFGSWFSVTFGCGSESVVLDTHPSCPLTHWKQDLLPMAEPFAVSKGDQLNGTIRLVRNAAYRRHLRVHLEFALTRLLQQDNEQSGGSPISRSLCFKVWR